ncbi:MAG: TolC family protein [Bacteroidota bacterium]
MFETRFIATFTLLLGWGYGLSQSVLEQYVAEGVQNNQQLLQEAMAVRSSRAALAEANGLFMPSVDFRTDYTIAGGGRLIQFPIGDLLNPVYSTLNQLTETQAFPTDLENVNEQFFPNEFHDTKIRVVQPLFNSDIYFNRKASQQLVNVAEAKRAVYEAELVKEIKIAYFQHLQAMESVDIIDANLVSLREVLRFNQRRYEEDLITVDEVYNVEFRLSQLQADRATAEQQLISSRAYFNFLLNRPVEELIVVDTTLTVDVAAGLAVSRSVALGNRMELQQVRAAKEAQEYGIRLARGSKLPQVSGVFDVGYQGFGYEFDSDQDYYLLNFSLSWNIFQGFQNQHRVQRQRIELEKLDSQEEQLKSQISLEVIQARQALLAAQQRREARESAYRSAQRSYRVTNSQYREDQALLLELLQVQAAMQSADLERSIAKYEIMAREAQLQRTLAY